MDKMKISKEVYDALVEWREYMALNQSPDVFVNEYALSNLPKVIDDWWGGFRVDTKESNDRLIAIIRWVNGEDVFEVEEPKKWVVRSKEPQGSVDGEPLYIWFVDELTLEIETEATMPPYIRRFNTKEEAQSWANSHQEVVEVEE